jgi:hypothetical protein
MGSRFSGAATASRRAATFQNNRFHRVFEELAAIGIHAEPAVYADDIADEVREQLLAVDGVLVWVDPIHEGQTRTVLDAMLRDVASRGPWVSAHPDAILKMGVKEVLHRTEHLGWGTDTHLYRTVAEFGDAFPSRLQSAGPRVLKQNRGSGGQGVWKVDLVSGPAAKASTVRLLEARRGSVFEEMSLGEFMTRCEDYFADGCIVDQPFQPHLPDGMIRCYMGADKVVGFGHQFIKALIPPPPEGPDSPAAQPGPRIMHGADAEPFQVLRAKMEAEWTPQMMEILGIDAASLPIIWDADFVYGPRTRRAKTGTSCAKSTSVRSSRSRTRHRQLSLVWHGVGCRAHGENDGLAQYSIEFKSLLQNQLSLIISFGAVFEA